MRALEISEIKSFVSHETKTKSDLAAAQIGQAFVITLKIWSF